jgi:putative component of membrane protein insertase Oxa1/YidC/SpoIIIJ protein YidD
LLALKHQVDVGVSACLKTRCIGGHLALLLDFFHLLLNHLVKFVLNVWVDAPRTVQITPFHRGGVLLTQLSFVCHDVANESLAVVLGVEVYPLWVNVVIVFFRGRVLFKGPLTGGLIIARRLERCGKLFKILECRRELSFAAIGLVEKVNVLS